MRGNKGRSIRIGTLPIGKVSTTLGSLSTGRSISQKGQQECTLTRQGCKKMLISPWDGYMTRVNNIEIPLNLGGKCILMGKSTWNGNPIGVQSREDMKVGITGPTDELSFVTTESCRLDIEHTGFGLVYNVNTKLNCPTVNILPKFINFKTELQSQRQVKKKGVRVVSWNACSLRSDCEKIQRVIDHGCDIVLIQETWYGPDIEVLNITNTEGERYNVKRMDRRSSKYKTGGGTMLMYKDGIEVIKEVRVSKDSALYQLIINTNEGTRAIWLANVYLNRGSKKQIQSLFKAVEKVIPPDYLKNTLLIGDYNVNLKGESPEKDLLRNLANSLGLNIISPKVDTRREAILDFVVAHKSTRGTVEVLDLIYPIINQ